MDAQELVDKLQQAVSLVEEIVAELGGQTTIGVVAQQAHTQMNYSLRSLTIVQNAVLEAQKASEDQETKDNLPRNAASPASDADTSES
jgi:hypothetical protein